MSKNLEKIGRRKVAGALFAGLLAIAPFARANTEHTVSVADGKRPYLLVTEDSDGASKREPGIYIADEAGLWHLAVRGNVLSGRFSAGLHQLFEVHGFTGRYESMFVQDGIPTIASVLSKPDAPATFLRLGTDTPVYDPLHRSTVRLPRVQSLDDLAVFTGQATQKGQLVLVSIRNHGPSLIGDGVTFALVLGNKDPRKPGEITMLGSPTVVEYRWRPATELRQLKDNLPRPSSGDEISPFAVVSPLIVQSMIRALPSDPPILTKWRKGLAMTLRTHAWSGTTPLYDAAEERVFMVGELAETIFQQNGVIQQNADALNQLHTVWYQSGNNDWRRFSGSVRARPDGKFQVYGSRQPGAAAVLVEDALQLILFEKQPLAGPLLRPSGKLEDLALHVVKIARPDSEHSDYGVLLSKKIDGKAQTSFLHLRVVGQTFEVLKNLPIQNEFYTADMLQYRLRVPREAYLLFDDQTPPQESHAAYEQAHKKTAPFIDLMASNGKDLQQAYLQPLEEVKITSHFTYRRYDSQGARKKIAGIYFHDSPKPAIEGELLTMAKQSQPAIGAVSMRLPGTDTTAKVTAVLVDAQHRKGEQGFAVGLIAEDENRKARFAATVPGIGANVGRLRSTLFLRGRDRAQDQFYLFLVFDGPNEQSAGSTIILAGRLSIAGDDGERELRLEVQRTERISEEALSEAQIMERIRRNDEGRLFWANDLRQTTVSSWKLHDLVTRREVLPNTAAERNRTKYVHLAEEELDPDGSLGPSRRGSWEVLSAWSLEGSLKEATKEGSSGKMEDEKIVDSLKGSELLFPLLMESLEAAADPTKPAQRRVVLVHEKLKKSLMRTVVGRWIERDAKRLWSSVNERLRLHAFHPKRASQPLVLENLEALANSPTGSRAVLLADAEELFDAGRVDVVGDEVPVRIDLPSMEEGTDPESITPHLLYWMGTDGESVPLPQLSPPPPPRFSQIIFATPEEWAQLKEEAGPEMAAGLEQRFTLDRNHLYSDWKIWSPDTGHAVSRVREVAKRAMTGFESDIFPSLAALLDEAATPSKPAEHRVLIVPAPLKQAVGDLMFQQWVRGERGQRWSQKNRHLELAYFDSGVTNANQTSILSNLDVLRATPANKRAILVTEIDKVATRPASSGDEPFELNETVIEGGGVTLSGSSRSFPPHMLYLLATEGRRLSFEEFEQETPGEHNKVGMLLVGTEEEWESLQRDLGQENRIGLADRFKVERLDPPSEETRKKLLRRVLDRPEIASIRYSFDASGVVQQDKLAEISSDEQLDKLLAFAVSRCQGLASQNGKEPISSFLDFVAVFGKSLIEDETIRRRRTLDRAAIERLFSKIFPMPINVTTLPPEDPLRRLQSPNFAFEWQGAGYESSIELKAKVVKTLLAQTRPDPVRKIPSSVILYGESRSGKTYLFETLCKTLGLKRYDYSRPKDPNAQALVINVGKLRPDPEGKEKKGNNDDRDDDRLPPASESMTVSEAVRHLHNFLKLPNGYRGHILFDDVHQAPEKVRSQIITLLRTLFESDRGLYRIPNADGSVEEVQVRNLSLYMTLNPTDDQERRRKFVTPQSGELGEVLAALGGHEVNEVRSFLERWMLVLNISRFPAEAKAPKLRDSLRQAARDVFNNQGKLVLVAPSAVQLAAQRFANDNANFLSRATPALIAQGLSLEGDVPLSVVVPNARGVASMQPRPQLFYPEVSGRIGTDVEPFLDENTVAVPVHGRFDGQVELLRILVGTLRTQVFEAFVRSIGEDPRYAAEADQRRLLLGPTLNAVVAHVTERGFLPMEHLRLDPAEFNVKTEIERDRFRRAIHAEPDMAVSFFPIRFGDELPTLGFLEELTRGVGDRQRNRADVLSEATEKLRGSLDRYLRMLLGIDPNADLPAPDKWLLGLKKREPEADERRIAHEFGDHFLALYEALFDTTLTEGLDASRFHSLSAYDAARMFLLAVDKAITKLPWGQVLRLVTSGLDMARDMSYGQRPGVQHFLFESQLSLLRPTTPERLLHRATNSQSYRDWSDERRNRQQKTFENRCSAMLVQEVKQ